MAYGWIGNKLSAIDYLTFKIKFVPRKPNSRWTPTQVKKFRANTQAWAFFNSQTPGYKKYMKNWINSAKKAATQENRLNDLIADSANGTKLKKIVAAQEKFKNRFAPGKTPIEESKNLGPITGIEMRSLGIETVEQLKRMGWEQAYQKLIQMYPNRHNLNMLYALAGAVNDQTFRKLDPELKAECKNLFREINSQI